MNIGIYSRKSKYSEKGESIDNQILFCKEYAAMHLKNTSDINFLIYEDEGFSAATTVRPGFQQLIHDIKEKKIQVLMCYRLDRINRNVSDFSKTLDLLEQYDVSFVSATENFDTATPMGKAMIYIASVFAQLERETTAERVRDNMLALSRTGRWLGGLTPMGYSSEAILYLDEELKERQLYKLVPKTEELHVIHQFFIKYLELKSLSKLESYCLSHYIKTQKGCDFSKNSLSLILRNPTYCKADAKAYEYFISLGCILANNKKEFDGAHGILCYNRTKHQTGKNQKKRPPSEWIIAIGKHEGLINGEDFFKVQNLIKQNKEKGNPRSESSNLALVSGKITCMKCNAKLRIKNIRKKDGHVCFSYACEKKVLSKGTRCDIRNIPGKQLDTFLLHLIVDLIGDNIRVTSYIPYLKNKENLLLESDIDLQEKILSLQNEYDILNQSIQNMVSQLAGADSNLTSKYILPKLKDMDGKLNTIEKEIMSLTLDSNDDLPIVALTKDKYKTLTDLHSLIEASDITQKKNLLNEFIKEIKWDGNQVWINLRTF